MIVEILVFIITFAIAYFVYIHIKVKSFFREKDVKFKPGVPMYGNTFSSMTQKKHMVEDIINIYNAFPDERYVGYIEGSNPIVMIRDPELIKSITVKHFEHFMDHKEFFPVEDDIFGKSVFVMKGDIWRDMRTTLSPAFTGSKMRLMLPSMMDVAKNVVNHLKEHHGENIDVDDVIRRYANDVIASAGFGLQVNSFLDKDNEFFKIGQTVFIFNWWQNMLMFFYLNCPKLCNKLRLRLFPKKTVDFFRYIVSSTIEYREKNNVERPDMIQLLMEASKGTLKPQATEEGDVGFASTEEILKPQGHTRKWTLDDLAGQVFIFFTAGFETTASTLVMCLHELALNTNIQEKLYKEVKEFQEKNTLAYENIGQLKYLDCVLNETMRKWSAALVMDRMCIKAFELPPPRDGGKPYQINPGDVVYNPVNAIHMDPKHWPEPESFIPERFSEENRHKITPFTFMPFGMGPRNCIGSRFAILELKVLLYYLILNFEVKKSEKTTDPIRLKPEGFLIKADGGTFVKFLSRN